MGGVRAPPTPPPQAPPTLTFRTPPGSGVPPNYCGAPPSLAALGSPPHFRGFHPFCGVPPPPYNTVITPNFGVFSPIIRITQLYPPNFEMPPNFGVPPSTNTPPNLPALRITPNFRKSPPSLSSPQYQAPPHFGSAPHPFFWLSAEDQQSLGGYPAADPVAPGRNFGDPLRFGGAAAPTPAPACAAPPRDPAAPPRLRGGKNKERRMNPKSNPPRCTVKWCRGPQGPHESPWDPKLPPGTPKSSGCYTDTHTLASWGGLYPNSPSLCPPKSSWGPQTLLSGSPTPPP